jgi:hypothetical protein
MTDVVAQLQECLELEEGYHTKGGRRGSFYGGSSSDLDLGYNAYAADSQSSDMSQTKATFEMGHNFGKMPRMGGGPVARQGSPWMLYSDVIAPKFECIQRSTL